MVTLFVKPKTNCFKWGSKSRASLKDLQNIFYEFEWPDGYGGSMWGDIASAAIKLSEARTLNDKAVWIDHIIDLQHNNDTVFDKNHYLLEIVSLTIAIKSSFDNVLDFYEYTYPYISSEVKEIYRDFLPFIRKCNNKTIIKSPDYKDIIDFYEFGDFDSYDDFIRTLKRQGKKVKKDVNRHYYNKLILSDLLDFYLCFYIKNTVENYGESYDVKHFTKIFQERINVISKVFYEYLYRSCLGEVITDYSDSLECRCSFKKSVFNQYINLKREEFIAKAKKERDKEAKKRKISPNKLSYKNWIEFYDSDDLKELVLESFIQEKKKDQKDIFTMIDSKMEYLFPSYMKILDTCVDDYDLHG